MTDLEYFISNLECSHINIIDIALNICKAIKVSLKVLQCKDRSAFYVRNRTVFSKIMLMYTSEKEIAKMLKCNRTNIYHYKKLDLQYDKELKELYDNTINIINH